MLDIVSHLVGVARMLDRYARRTNSVDEKVQAVRDVIFNATEPDEILFTSLSKAVDMNPFDASMDVNLFANTLTESMRDLQGALGSTLDGLKGKIMEGFSDGFLKKIPPQGDDCVKKIQEGRTPAQVYHREVLAGAAAREQN